MSHGLAYSISTGEVTQGMTIDVRAGGKLTVFDPHDARVRHTVAVGQSPSWPPLEDALGARLFFTSGGPSAGFNAFPDGPGAVSIVDAATGILLWHITVGFMPSLIGIDPASGRLLVLNAAGDDTAPFGPGPVCSARTQISQVNTPSCRAPSASLSIITTAP